MTTQIQLKRGNASDWANSRLAEGEPGIDLTNKQVRIGGPGGTTFAFGSFSTADVASFGGYTGLYFDVTVS